MLPPRVKGKLGELATAYKTTARGDGEPFGFGNRFNLDGGGHTFTDSQFHSSDPTKRIGINEDKVGPEATMTPRQIQAEAQPDIEYVVNGYRYNDFGKMFGVSASPYGAQLLDQGGYPWSVPQD